MRGQTEKNRILYIDALRVFAIIGVVMIHVSSVALRQTADTVTFVAGVFYNSAVRWAVPIFFMITGAMFLRPGKTCTFRGMLTKYVVRLVYCILIWGTVYAALDVYLYDSFSPKSIVFCIWNTISDHSGYHLWYLFALIGLYLVMPVFQILVNNLKKRQLEYILLLWMVLSLGVSQFNELMKTLEFPFNLAWYFPMITSWAGYILLGHYLFTYEISGRAEKVLILGGALILPLVCSLLNVWFSMRTGKAVSAFMAQDGLTAGCAAIGVFLLVKKAVGCSVVGGMLGRIGRCGKYVFGIYLIHVLVNSTVFHVMGVPINIVHPFLSIPLFTSIVFAISFLITALFHRIPGVKRIV